MAPPAKRKILLTDISVKKQKEGRTWDSEIGGFGIKVYASGKRQLMLHELKNIGFSYRSFIFQLIS